MNLEERKQKLREEYGWFSDPQELFEYIIGQSKILEPLDKSLKIDEFIVKGCVSSLWLVPSFDKDKNICSFRSDADSLVTRGVAAIVCKLCSGLPPDEILSLDPSFMDELGIASQLSPNRRNGLGALLSKIREFAQLCKISE